MGKRRALKRSKLKSRLERMIASLPENQVMRVADAAKKLKVSWATARSLLMELAVEGKIEALKTKTGYGFKR